MCLQIVQKREGFLIHQDHSTSIVPPATTEGAAQSTAGKVDKALAALYSLVCTDIYISHQKCTNYSIPLP